MVTLYEAGTDANDPDLEKKVKLSKNME